MILKWCDIFVIAVKHIIVLTQLVKPMFQVILLKPMFRVILSLTFFINLSMHVEAIAKVHLISGHPIMHGVCKLA